MTQKGICTYKPMINFCIFFKVKKLFNALKIDQISDIDLFVFKYF